MDHHAITSSIRQVLEAERSGIDAMLADLDQQNQALADVCQLIHDRTGKTQHGRSHGRLVITGVGKAGLIGRKLSATFASTGTPSFFLHPAEARHGDLGMVQEQDVVLALSNSGSSEEVTDLLPSLERIGSLVVALVGKTDSPLGKMANHVISIGNINEACPLGLAPSSSTTAMLAMGDAIALTVQQLRSFTPADYARFHPAGALGRKLMTCGEAMRPRDRVATVTATDTVWDAVQTITNHRAGCAIILEHDKVIGLFSDGDLRRSLTDRQAANRVLSESVVNHASCPCTTIRDTDLVQSALHLFATKHFDDLPVVDADGSLVGLIDPQDLTHRGFEV